MSANTKRIRREGAVSVRLAEHLERVSVNRRQALKTRLCATLKEAYDKTPDYNYIVDLELPGGPSKSPSAKGMEDPRRPGDVQPEYGVRLTSRPNPHKQELLEQALALGCAWAKEEQKKPQMEPQTKEVAP
ncbi:MAG: hypothetical protein JXA78_04740 [Anaerolineales bacterium]|nr:hypothetical protein [Anaerolineales bacterium]